MMKRLLLCCLLSACLLPLRGQADSSLSARIDWLVRETLPEGSEAGVCVYDLTAGKPLYAYRAEKLSRPASTMKLLTAITALARPDADEPFRTEVWYDGAIANDTLRGDLYVVGGFDPEFGEEAMDSLVARTASLPFTVVTGRVYGDVSMKDSLYWGNGWAWDDNPAAYQPYLSPLMFCKGAVELRVSPGQTGDTAIVSYRPASSYYTVVNLTRSRTPSAGEFAYSRDWLSNGNRVVVSGNVEGTRKGAVNLYGSSEFFMHAFVERLRSRGIAVSPDYAFAELPSDSLPSDSLSPSPRRIACWETPVRDVLKQLMKESDNLNAEAMLCRIGARATGKKHISAKEGIAEIEKLIRRLGRDPKGYKIADGCGLSNYNYLSPALLVEFLKFAYAKPDIYRGLREALPVAGVDGTLEHRMKDTPARGNVRAKTGSFTAINALAGYVRAMNGHDLAFAIMNQNILSAARARAFQDKVCVLLRTYGKK